MLAPAASNKESHNVESLLGLRRESFHVLVEPQCGAERHSQDLTVPLNRKGRAILGHNRTVTTC